MTDEQAQGCGAIIGCAIGMTFWTAVVITLIIICIKLLGWI